MLSIGASTKPAASSAAAPGGFLAYVKGYTEEPNTSASKGRLARLQLVWATRTCPSATPAAPAPTQPSPSPVFQSTPSPAVQQPSPPPATTTTTPPAASSPPPATTTTPPPATTTPPAPAAKTCTPAASAGCSKGRCPTSSCALSGMGSAVPLLFCYGSNTMPNVLLDATVGNPCAYLACKLDTPGCASLGLLGVGGFCTGRIVAATGNDAKLSTVGRAHLGAPCIAHTGPALDIIPVADDSAGSTRITKARTAGRWLHAHMQLCLHACVAAAAVVCL